MPVNKSEFASHDWVVIDGSYGEGGGQILRTSLALSALTGQAVHIERIRAGRERPGLRPQHLTGVHAVQTITNAYVEGDRVNSMALKFAPSKLQSGEWTFDISAKRPSAGSIALVFQTVLPALLFAGGTSTVHIVRGGTHVPMSPPMDYIKHVFLPTLARMGANVDLEVERAGWYPKGGGAVHAHIHSLQKLTPVQITERGALKRIHVLSAVSNLKRSIAERQARQAQRRLNEMGISRQFIEVTTTSFPSIGQGTMVFLLAEYEHVVAGFSSLGERGKPAERVADEAIDEFAQYLAREEPVDPRLSDQLVLYMALAEGQSLIRTSQLTLHTTTNVWVVQRFLPVEFNVSATLGQPAEIRVDGMGFGTARSG